MKNSSIFKSTIKQGIIMGLCFCAYTLIMWVTKLDTAYLSIGQYLDMAIIILPLFVIFWAIRQEHRKDTITIVQRIAIAVFVGLISFLIYNPFLYVYHHFINPDWFISVLNLKETELKSINMPKAEITSTLEKMKISNVAQSGLFRLSALIPSVLILPTLIALLSMLFIGKKQKP